MNPAIRVLYAEDNPQDADQTRSHFAEHAPEFEIEIVATGQACLERLPKAGFDLLLLDYRLPDMDGLDVLKTLSHIGWQSPVVMVTGVGDEDLVVKALRLGAVNYMPKQSNYLETLPELLRGVVLEHQRKQSMGLLTAAVRRILYVEHDLMDIDLTVRHFADAAPHFVVDVVQSCNEALSRLEQPHEYSLVLVDLRMPGRCGLEFVREAKRSGLRLPPFIIVSGRGDEATAIACLRLGAADYIIKREGYLDQLTHTIDRAIAYDQLNRLDEQLRCELAERKRAEELQRRAAEAAQAANLAKSEFLAKVSHEFRTPLHAILGFTEGLLERVDCHPLNEQQKDRLTRVLYSGRHLLGLVNKILDVTTIQSGSMRVDIAPFDVGQLAQEVCRLCEALVERKPEVRIVLDVESGLPWISSDREKIKEILLNLIDNAVAFTDRGSVTLRGRLRRSMLLLSVEDTGVGIPEEHLGQVFDAFYQVELPGTHARQGAGLGLAICKAFAELLGGTISLQSKVGCGTRATVTLPLQGIRRQADIPTSVVNSLLSVAEAGLEPARAVMPTGF
jgi:signal transduction histidine kinase